MHVYIMEHKVSLFDRTARWKFTKLGKYEVLMASHIRIVFSARSTLGWIEDREK